MISDSTFTAMAKAAMLKALSTDAERRSDAERFVYLTDTRILDRQKTFIYFAEELAHAVAALQREQDATIAERFEVEMECANDCGEKIAVAIRATPQAKPNKQNA